ncbi:MAG: CDP-diacylglycerol--glycerol-3-phosphate 3-phosphatidyltransferase [Chloroflexi bacterium]|nr:CDP-diacylglycerol--glycerol-3-phosphate 3-phosphatidyltransferase [Chloroflexota bacterium]
MPVGIATQLTLLRMVLAPVILYLIVWGEGSAEWYWLAAALLVIAAATDWLDGFVARRRNTVSAVGASLDLVADKVLVAVVLIALVQVGLLPGWWAAVVVSREMAVTGLRVQAAEKGVSIPAGRAGKLKTGITFIALIVLILWRSIVGDSLLWVTDILLWLALILTVYSGAEYVYTGIRKIREVESTQSANPESQSTAKEVRVK